MASSSIRKAVASDNEPIRELSERCYQEGMITMFVNRTPCFNTLHRLIDPGSWHYVTCHEEKITGLVGVVHFPWRVMDKTIKAGYMLDLRVAQEHRRGMTAYRLVKSAIDDVRVSDTGMVIANFLKDNRHSLIFTTGKGGIPDSLSLGENRIFNILPVRKMKVSQRFEITAPTAGDIPEIVSLLNKYAEGFKMAPVITNESFRKITGTIEGLSIENFLIARENGTIKAVTAAWDEHAYKSYQVLKLTPGIRLAAGALRLLSLFMKTPHPIRLNEPLRQLSLVFYAHDGCPEALEDLFRHVNNMHRGGKYTLIMLYAQQNDPVFSIVKNFTGVSVKSEMYIFAKDTSVYRRLSEDKRPVLFDMAMIL